MSVLWDGMTQRETIKALLNFEWVESGEMFVKKAVTKPANSRRDLFWAAQIREATIVGFA